MHVIVILLNLFLIGFAGFAIAEFITIRKISKISKKTDQLLKESGAEFELLKEKQPNFESLSAEEKKIAMEEAEKTKDKLSSIRGRIDVVGELLD